MDNNIFTKELDDDTLLINSINEKMYPLDSLNYITLSEKYNLIKANEEKLVNEKLELNKTINNLRNIIYNSHKKNQLLSEKLNHNNLINENLKLDIIEMNKELDEYENIFKNLKELNIL